MQATLQTPNWIWSNQGYGETRFHWENTTDSVVWAPIYRMRTHSVISVNNSWYDLGDTWFSPNASADFTKIPANASGGAGIQFRFPQWYDSQVAVDGFGGEENWPKDPNDDNKPYRWTFALDVLQPDSDEPLDVESAFATPLSLLDEGDRDAVVDVLEDVFGPTEGSYTIALQELRKRLDVNPNEPIDMLGLLQIAVDDAVASLPNPSLHGTLVDGAGKPVAGQLLRIEPEVGTSSCVAETPPANPAEGAEGHDPYQDAESAASDPYCVSTRYVRTSSTGTWAIRRLEDGPAKIYIDGYGPYHVTTVASPQADVQALTLPTAWPRLSGTLYDEVGLNVQPNTAITIFPAGRNPIEDHGQTIDWARTITDANGHYEFGGIKPGTYQVEMLGMAGSTGDGNESVGSITVTGSSPQDPQLRMGRTYRVSLFGVRGYSDYEPLDEATVELVDRDKTPHTQVRLDGNVVTLSNFQGVDENGPWDESSRVTLRVSNPGYVTTTQGLSMRYGLDVYGRVAAPSTSIYLSPGTPVHGTVKDTDGTSVANALVQVQMMYAYTPTSKMAPSGLPLTTRADAEGKYEVRVNPGIATAVTVTASGLNTTGTTTEPIKGAAAGRIIPTGGDWSYDELPIDVTVQRTAHVTITVKDGYGEPVKQAQVVATPEADAVPDDEPEEQSQMAITADDGVAALSLPAGTWTISSGNATQDITVAPSTGTCTPDDEANDYVDCVNEKSVTLVDTTEYATVSGTLPATMNDGQSADSGYLLVWLRTDGGQWSNTVADIDGNFSITAAPGTEGALWVFDPYLGVLTTPVTFDADRGDTTATFASPWNEDGDIDETGHTLTIPLDLIQDPYVFPNGAEQEAYPYEDNVDGSIPDVYLQPLEFANGAALDDPYPYPTCPEDEPTCVEDPGAPVGLPALSGTGAGMWLIPSGQDDDLVQFQTTPDADHDDRLTGILTLANVPPGAYRVTVFYPNEADRIAEFTMGTSNLTLTDDDESWDDGEGAWDAPETMIMTDDYEAGGYYVYAPDYNPVIYDIRSTPDSVAEGAPVRRYLATSQWGLWQQIVADGDYTVNAYDSYTGEILKQGVVFSIHTPPEPDECCPDPGSGGSASNFRAPGRAFLTDANDCGGGDGGVFAEFRAPGRAFLTGSDGCDDDDDGGSGTMFRAPGRAFTTPAPAPLAEAAEPAALRAPGRAFLAEGNDLDPAGDIEQLGHLLGGDDAKIGPPPSYIGLNPRIADFSTVLSTQGALDWARNRMIQNNFQLQFDSMIWTIEKYQRPDYKDCVLFDDTQLIKAKEEAALAEKAFHVALHATDDWGKQVAITSAETAVRGLDIAGKAYGIKAVGIGDKLKKLGSSAKITASAGRSAFKAAMGSEGGNLGERLASSVAQNSKRWTIGLKGAAAAASTKVATDLQKASYNDGDMAAFENAVGTLFGDDAAAHSGAIKDVLGLVAGNYLGIAKQLRGEAISLQDTGNLLGSIVDSWKEAQTAYYYHIRRMYEYWDMYQVDKAHPKYSLDESCLPVIYQASGSGGAVYNYDPNALTGPLGDDSAALTGPDVASMLAVLGDHRIDPASQVAYHIDFENVGPGTPVADRPEGWQEKDAAPVKDVTVTLPIPDGVDAATVTLGAFGFGGESNPTVLRPPAGATTLSREWSVHVTVPSMYQPTAEELYGAECDPDSLPDGEACPEPLEDCTEADLSGDQVCAELPIKMAEFNVTMHAEAHVNASGRTVTWRIWVDPGDAKDLTTEDAPESAASNVFIGFLMPEPGPDSGMAGAGQGFAELHVQAPSTPAGSTAWVNAKATIGFDENEPMGTNTWRNRVFLAKTTDNPGDTGGSGGGGSGAGSGGAAGASGDRLAGSNRYGTAAAVAVEFGSANALVLANGEDALGGADALAANYLAGKVHGPIVLTQANRLPAESAAAIAQVLQGASNPTIYVMGGPSSVSEVVAAAAKAAAGKVAVGTVRVVRIAGANRFETSALAATTVGAVDNSIGLTASGAKATTAILASGMVNADALAAGALSYAWGIPVLLTAAGGLSDAVVKVIRDQHITQLVILGGPDRVSQAVLDQAAAAGVTSVKRIAGADRFATATELYAWALDQAAGPGGGKYGAAGAGVFLANGYAGFPDALAAGPLVGKTGGILLTSNPDALPEQTGTFLGKYSKALGAVTGLGGPASVADTVLQQATASLH